MIRFGILCERWNLVQRSSRLWLFGGACGLREGFDRSHCLSCEHNRLFDVARNASVSGGADSRHEPKMTVASDITTVMAQ